MNANTILIITIILAVALWIIDYLHSRKVKKISDNLVKLLVQENFSELDRELNSDRVIKNIPFYNREMLSFNSAILQRKKGKADQLFDEMLKIRMSQNQQDIFYSKALGYYVGENDEKRCKKCIKQLKGFSQDQNFLKQTELIENIFVHHQTDSLQALLEKIEKDQNEQKALDLFLVSKIYEIMGNTDLSERYHHDAEKEMIKL